MFYGANYCPLYPNDFLVTRTKPIDSLNSLYFSLLPTD